MKVKCYLIYLIQKYLINLHYTEIKKICITQCLKYSEKRKLYIIFQCEEKYISDFEKENDLLIIAGWEGKGGQSHKMYFCQWDQQRKRTIKPGKSVGRTKLSTKSYKKRDEFPLHFFFFEFFFYINGFQLKNTHKRKHEYHWRNTKKTQHICIAKKYSQ